MFKRKTDFLPWFMCLMVVIVSACGIGATGGGGGAQTPTVLTNTLPQPTVAQPPTEAPPTEAPAPTTPAAGPLVSFGNAADLHDNSRLRSRPWLPPARAC